MYHEQDCKLLTGGNDHKILVWTVDGDRDEVDEKSQQSVRRCSRVLQSDAEQDAVQSGAMMSQAELQTLDTWSDEEEDEVS